MGFVVVGLTVVGLTVVGLTVVGLAVVGFNVVGFDVVGFPLGWLVSPGMEGWFVGFEGFDVGTDVVGFSVGAFVPLPLWSFWLFEGDLSALDALPVAMT